MSFIISGLFSVVKLQVELQDYCKGHRWRQHQTHLCWAAAGTTGWFHHALRSLLSVLLHVLGVGLWHNFPGCGSGFPRRLLNRLIPHRQGHEVRLNPKTWHDCGCPGSNLVRGLRPIKSNQGLQVSRLRSFTSVQVSRWKYLYFLCC